MGNTSFVGFPVIEALYGKKGLETAIIVDQPGTFVVMATLGIIVASIYSKGTPNPKSIASKILLFPPFIAFFLAVMMNLFKFDFVEDLQLAWLCFLIVEKPTANLQQNQTWKDSSLRQERKL